MKLVIVFIVVLASFGHAHPVIYKGGWVYQGSFMPQMNEMKMSYSFDPKWSVVLNSHRFERIDEYQNMTVGVNTLLKRWLHEDSQANLYFGAHQGLYEDKNGDGDITHTFLMADWENREDYVMAKSKKFF